MHHKINDCWEVIFIILCRQLTTISVFRTIFDFLGRILEEYYNCDHRNSFLKKSSMVVWSSLFHSLALLSLWINLCCIIFESIDLQLSCCLIGYYNRFNWSTGCCPFSTGHWKESIVWIRSLSISILCSCFYIARVRTPVAPWKEDWRYLDQ